MEGHWKFLGGGRGVLKAKFLEAMYENKLEFPGGEGVQNKKKSSRVDNYFLESAQYQEPITLSVQLHSVFVK